MISGRLKNAVKPYGLTQTKNMYYGNLGGYLIMLRDENVGNVAQIVVQLTARFENEEVRIKALERILNADTYPEKRVFLQATYANGVFEFRFANTLGSNKRVQAVADALPSLLREYKAKGMEECTLCGLANDAYSEYCVINDVVQYVHASCVDLAIADAQVENDEFKMQRKNTVRGIIGALLGGIVGAIPWVVAYYFGWFVGIFGLLIGIAAKKGYEVLGGKPSKGKAWIILLVTIICIVFALFAGDIIDLAIMIGNGEINLLYSQIVPYIIYVLKSSSEYLASVLFNLVLSLLFGLIGVVAVMRDTRKEVKEQTSSVTRLKGM